MSLAVLDLPFIHTSLGVVYLQASFTNAGNDLHICFMMTNCCIEQSLSKLKMVE